MDFFIKHQKVLFRSIGGALIFISFVAFFWTTPKEGFTENEIAAANVARMEARMAGQSSSTSAVQKENKSPFLETYKETQERHMRYMLIVMMIFGVGFLAYSFLKKDKDQNKIEL